MYLGNKYKNVHSHILFVCGVDYTQGFVHARHTLYH
jgi:hypothetical protein